MTLVEKIKLKIAKKINKALAKELVKASDFVYPPNPEMGDLSLPCFEMAKELKKSPVEVAQQLVEEFSCTREIDEVRETGPYLNFVLNQNLLAEETINAVLKKKDKYGKNNTGNKKKIMVEFAHPNTHKAFHIGHLRNITTGESIVRILENNGYKVVRANYQGDIGLHIAKCLWGINKLKKEYKEAKKKDINARAEFLGKAYSEGSKNYEEDEKAKGEITELNKKIYNKDKDIIGVYKTTRKWSLEYFSKIYKRVHSKFNRLYFESEVFDEGKKIVLENLDNGIFKKSDGAVIFEGEKCGLHNRVFINSQGNPTYEAKDLGLAKLQFSEYNPEKIIHVVGPEQSEYFKVLFKALEIVMPLSQGREKHLNYGWVRLKEGKMSSRLGNVILGEWLLDEVKKEITKIMEKNENLDEEDSAEKISMAAVKYSILKNGVSKDIAFDINESVSLSGNSGPYLLYTYARINSILNKANKQISNKANLDLLSESREKNIILKLAKYPEIAMLAGEKLDPSEIAKYLFELAQLFNDYYHSVPVLKADDGTRNARLALLGSVNQVIKNGLYLLGIEVLEGKM